MTDDLDIDELRRKLHSNLVLVEKQISSYSSKFKRKLTSYLKGKDKLLDDSFPILKNATYKIQNAISDDLNNILIILSKSSSGINPAMLKSYIVKNEIKVDKKALDNLNLLENEIISYIKREENVNNIEIIKKLFDSYRESINFTIRSLNKKISDLVNIEIANLSKNSNIMQKDNSLIFALSFFNISYDRNRNALFINDNNSIITLHKTKEGTYRINENINLMIKYKKDSFAIALEVNGVLAKIINMDNRNDIITFMSNKKDGKNGVSYSINSNVLAILENDKIEDERVDDIDDLSSDMKGKINSIEPSLLYFIKLLSERKKKDISVTKQNLN